MHSFFYAFMVESCGQEEHDMIRGKTFMKRILAMAVAAVLVFSAVSCGAGYSSVEEAYNSDSSVQELLDGYAYDDTALIVSDDNITYTHKFSKKSTDKSVKDAVKDIKENIGETEKTFEDLLKEVRELSGIEDAAIELIYTDKDDKVVFRHTYSRTE